MILTGLPQPTGPVPELVRVLRVQGWHVDEAQPGQRRPLAFPPDTSRGAVTLPLTCPAEDARGLLNTLTALRRSGLVWPWPPALPDRGSHPTPPPVPGRSLAVLSHKGP